MIRRLDPIADESLLRESFAWDRNAPQWYKDQDSVFGPQDVDDFLTMLKEPNHILIGIFDVGMIGLLVLEHVAQDVFNAHLWAKRKAPFNVLAEGAYQVIQDFLRMGMKEGVVWVGEKNVGVRKLCDNIGFQHDGICMFKGSYRNRLIKWLRYSVKAKAVELEVAA